MHLKDYPEIIMDAIPKLYESHNKVFITHLYGVQEQVNRLPKKFCKMYTTAALAEQLLLYLSPRNANISKEDFHIIEAGEPFVLRLSDGKRLQVMLCAGNELGNSLMLLIRKLHGGRLLYYYSAVQQEDLCYLMGNATYQEWIVHGTEMLFLNLQAANKPFEHIDFNAIADELLKNIQNIESPIVMKLPLFGFEFLAKRLAQTRALHGGIKMPGFQIKVYIMDTHETEECPSIASSEDTNPMNKLKWSPVPTRMNLIQLCSLLRPLHISGIVGYHDKGNAPSVPEYLKRFKLKYSPKPKELGGAVTEMGENTQPVRTQQAAKTQNDPFVYTKPRKIAFVDYDDDTD